MKFDFKKNLPHIIAVFAILLINVFYFIPQFQGQKIIAGDISAYRGAAQEANSYRAETGDEALWTNSMFGGMPVFVTSLKQKNNVAKVGERVLSFNMTGPAGYFIMGMLAFYICLILLGVNPWVSLIMSIVFSLSTSNLMLFGAGHNNKVRAIMASAPIIAGTILIMKGRIWTGAFAFTLFLAIAIMANHPQMIYYLGMAMAIYMIFALVDAVQKKDLKSYGKGLGILVLSSIIALGISASTLMPTYEYGKETMRGKPILTQTANAPKTSSSVEGLEFEYAMNWSTGALDAISMFIPYAAGGGSVEKFSKDSRFAKVTNQRREVSAPSYFGAIRPNTAGPYYFGAIVFLLFVFGSIVVKGRIKWWLISAFIFTIMISYGKNFELLNKTLYDYFPLFNKFRAPNSVLSITGLMMLVLAGLGFNELVSRENKTELLKPLMYAVGGVAGFSLLFGLIGPSFISFESVYDARMGSDQRIIDALYADRQSLMTGSAYRTAGLVLFAGLFMYFYLKGKLNKFIMLALVGLFAISEQFLISKNYFGDNWGSKSKYNQVFTERPADKQILADNDPHYRVQDFSIDTYNSSDPSYFHKMIGGYSAAKLQRAADIIERHLSNRSQQNPYGNQAVLNMMNAKYFIIPTGENAQAAQQNPGALGNAWFVNDVKFVASANEEIDALNGFDPSSTAIVHQEFKNYLGSFNPSKSGTINLTKYSPNVLEYSCNATAEQLAVFSEVWYGPNLGWQAYIDDQPVDHIRANYILRAMKIPAGQHTIKFVFNPSSYRNGKMISLVCSILLLILGGFLGFKMWQNRASQV